MTIREYKKIVRQIAQLEMKLARLRAESVNTSPSLSGMPNGSDVSDKVGKNVAEIFKAEKELHKLEVQRSDAISRLSPNIYEENCIYFFLVKNFTWEKVSRITNKRVDTADSIRIRCSKYVW